MRRALAVLLLLGSGCFDHSADTPLKLGRMGKLYGGAEGIDTVESPDRVEAFRLRPPSSDQKIERYNQWPTLGPAVRVPADVASRFSKGLTRESTYPNWDTPKACDPQPGFLLRFHAGGRSVDVAFCFECQILFTYRGSESIWYANFDESTKTIAALFLQIFPGDPVLAKLAA